MTFFPTRFTNTATRLVLLILAALAGCSFTPTGRLVDGAVGIVLVDGFDEADQEWASTGNRYWKAELHRDGLTVSNTPLGAGVSPIWYEGEVTRDFEVAVRATIEKEGLDGGWGVEFGARDRKYAYRVLVYASGRFCVDRLFGLYPEFIHCVPTQPEIETGESTNTVKVRVEGEKISVFVNEAEIVVFTDDRYEAGEVALGVAGAGTRVFFDDIALLSLE